MTRVATEKRFPIARHVFSFGVTTEVISMDLALNHQKQGLRNV